MSDYMSPSRFVHKIEWEGGIIGALDYGLKHTHLDPEDEKSRELRDKWKKIEEAYAEVDALESDLIPIIAAIDLTDEQPDE